MRKYEVMYILQPTLSAEEQTALVNRFNDLIASMGGAVTGIATMTTSGTVLKLENTEHFERRTLAYDLKGFRDGYYVVIDFDGDPTLETEMDRQMKLTEPILRHMITRPDEK